MTSDSMGDKLSQVFTPVFLDKPLFVTDCLDVHAFLVAQGCPTLSIDDPTITRDALNLVFIATNVQGVDRLWESVRPDSKVVAVPLVAFDPTPDNAKYNLDLIAKSDFVRASKRNEEILKLLLGATHPLDMHGHDSQLTCRLDSQLEVMAPRFEYPLKSGHTDGIGAFFEVGMIVKDGHCGFHADGRLSVPGLCIAHRRELEAEGIWRKAWDFMVSLHRQGGFPLTLEIADSRVISAVAGNRDITSELRYFTRDENLQVEELSVGTNYGIDPGNVDWTMNSQIHEGMSGIHAGIGDGTKGLHIDFICPGLSIT